MNSNRYILIVDDDADDRDIIKDAFINAAGEQQFVFLQNGDQLLDYLHRHADNGAPSLILLDLNMPGKDGREVLKEIKANKRYSYIPIIVFTTSSAPKDKAISYSLGANCFITKPDTFNKLVDVTGSIAKLWLQQ